jgi:glutathione peroxidase
MSIYDYSFTDNNENLIEMSTFKDNVLLLVNVASKCGNTPQYEDLQRLHKEYYDKGLRVIGFPCNQFGFQEQGTDEEIKEFCKNTYGVDFLMSKKIDVVGPMAHPMFKFIEDTLGHPIPWNFVKFVVDKAEKNEPIRDSSPDTEVNALEEQIRILLGL